MKLDDWCVSLDGLKDYSISKSDDQIISIQYQSHTIATVHLNENQPIFVTSDAIIKLDPNNKHIVICSPNDGVKRFSD